MRRLFRRVRFLSTLPTALWLYRNRREVVRAGRFAATVPTKVRCGRWQDVQLEGRARLALLSDAELRNGPVEVVSAAEGTVTLTGPSGDSRTERARRVVADMEGVLDVRVDDPQAHPATDSTSGGDVRGTATVPTPATF